MVGLEDHVAVEEKKKGKRTRKGEEKIYEVDEENRGSPP